MVSFSDIVGYRYETDLDNGRFTVTYYGLSNEHWRRIRNVALLLSDNEIGARVIGLENSLNVVTYEEVTPFHPEKKPDGVDVNMLKGKILSVIRKMHSLKWTHGNLHMGNLGYRNGDIYDVVILDADTMHKIMSSGHEDWLTEWASESGTDWASLYWSDFDKWIVGWLE